MMASNANGCLHPWLSACGILHSLALLCARASVSDVRVSLYIIHIYDVYIILYIY